jgi:hypothetical protein
MPRGASSFTDRQDAPSLLSVLGEFQRRSIEPFAFADVVLPAAACANTSPAGSTAWHFAALRTRSETAFFPSAMRLG